MSTFRIATRDELWSQGRLLESRLSHGEAHEVEGGFVATDAPDDSLVELCERGMVRLRATMPRDARVRIVAEAASDGLRSTMTVRRGGLSIVTTPDDVAEDDALLQRVIRSVVNDPPAPGRPIVWKNGTAAVLLHEAIGHAAEHGHGEVVWPAWLTVDLGLRPRRATFRDVPLLRMSRVSVTHNGAPFALPDDAVEVVLVSAGLYEPLTETVTLQLIASNTAPFEYRATRREIAGALAGAIGEPIRYPGVICSREGQELVVPCSAPVMVTR